MVGVRGPSDANSAVSIRELAEREGHKIIRVKQLNPNFDGALGLDVLHYAARYDYNTDATKYSLSVGGGPMNFVYDAAVGGRVHDLVDTPHNRKQLAALVKDGMVEVIDKPEGGGEAGKGTGGEKVWPPEFYNLKSQKAGGAEKMSKEADAVPPIAPESVPPPVAPKAPVKRPASRPPNSPLVQITDEE